MAPQKHRNRRTTNRTKDRPEKEQFIIGNYASIIGSICQTLKAFPNTTNRQVIYYREKVEKDIHWAEQIHKKFLMISWQ